MVIEFTYTGLLHILGFVQGLLLGAVFIVRGRTHQSYTFLGLFLLGWSINLLRLGLIEWNILATNPALLLLPTNMYFLYMPALYLYTRSLTKGISFKVIMNHLGPALVEFVVFSALFLLPVDIKQDLAQSSGFAYFMNIYWIAAYLMIVFYVYSVFYLTRTHNLAVEAYYSNVEDKLLHWLQAIAVYVVVVSGAVLTLMLLGRTSDGSPPVFILSLINLAFIFTVAVTGLTQVRVKLPEEDEEEEIEVHVPLLKPYLAMGGDRSVANDSNDQIRRFGDVEELKQISSVIQDKKYYARPTLTLGKLAGKLNYSQRRLSNLINEVGGTNFRLYIHSFRVEAAKRMLVDETYANWTMTAIAEEVGFNSKATFYAIFRQLTATTPLRYQRAHQLTV